MVITLEKFFNMVNMAFVHFQWPEKRVDCYIHMKLRHHHHSYHYCQQLTNKRWGGVQGMVLLLFTLLPVAIMQNFSLHNTADSIYG